MQEKRSSKIEYDPLKIVTDDNMMRMISIAHHDENNLQAFNEEIMQAHYIPPSPPSHIKIDIPFFSSGVIPH